MILNNECLLHLLECFNILELTEIRGTCSRLDTLIDGFRHKHVNFDFADLWTQLPYDLTLDNTNDILKFVGPTMKTLKIDGRNFSFDFDSNLLLFECIVQFCKKLESLDIDNFKLDPSVVKKLTPLIKNLKSLSVGESIIVDDELGAFFEGASNLKELKIFRDCIPSVCLMKVFNLNALSVNDCSDLGSESFKEMLKKNKTLKTLEIHCCENFDNSVVDCIVDDVSGIEELSFSSNSYTIISNLSRFAELPNLKILFIECLKTDLVNSLLETLSEQNMLEELHLHHHLYLSSFVHPKSVLISKITNLKMLSMKYTITDPELRMLQNLSKLESISIPEANQVTLDELLSFLTACKNIKYLDVSSTNVDLNFLQKVIEIWQLSECRPKLEMVVHGTNSVQMSEQVQNLIKDNQTILKLSFASKQDHYNQSYNDYDDGDRSDRYDLYNDQGEYYYGKYFNYIILFTL